MRKHNAKNMSEANVKNIIVLPTDNRTAKIEIVLWRKPIVLRTSNSRTLSQHSRTSYFQIVLRTLAIVLDVIVLSSFSYFDEKTIGGKVHKKIVGKKNFVQKPAPFLGNE